MTFRAAVIVALTGLFVASGGPAAAQGIRGTAVSTARLIELRPLVTDTIPSTAAADTLPCPPGPTCVFLRPGPVEQTYAFTQDVRVTGWGFGVTGLSATAFLRARAHAGDGAVWPRADDAFDAMLAYVEYDRDPIRIRAGRQMNLGGLGFASYDGVSAVYRSGPALSAEAWAGRSLARGLAEPRSEAVEGFDDLVSDPSVILLGGALAGAPVAGLSIAARYQREIFADRAGLASERASVDVTLAALRPVRIQASADWDFAFGRVGKANLLASVPVTRGLRFDAEAVRYVPYFELWTIWGFFDPVAWHQGAVRLRWRPVGGVLHATGSIALRRYEETHAGIFGGPMDRDARRIEVEAGWRVRPDLRLDARVRHESGFGAAFGGGDASVAWQPSERLSVRAFGTIFDQAEDFRVGLETVVGGGLSARIGLRQDLELDAGLSFYHQATTRPASPDWTQRRAWLGLRIDFGRDPGMAVRGGAR